MKKILAVLSVSVTWLKNNWFKVGLIMIALFAFYWYSWRPYEIRKYCGNHAFEANKNADNTFNLNGYNGTYKECLQGRGLAD